jgi:hypothetical protein
LSLPLLPGHVSLRLPQICSGGRVARRRKNGGGKGCAQPAAMAAAPREQQSEEGAKPPRERRGRKVRQAALLEAPRAAPMAAALLEEDQTRAAWLLVCSRRTRSGRPWLLLCSRRTNQGQTRPRRPWLERLADLLDGVVGGFQGTRVRAPWRGSLAIGVPARTVEALQALWRGVAAAGVEAGGARPVAGGDAELGWIRGRWRSRGGRRRGRRRTRGGSNARGGEPNWCM